MASGTPRRFYPRGAVRGVQRVRAPRQRGAREQIAAGARAPLRESTPEWIVKASGIQRRYVEDKTGLLDPERMCPNIADRSEDQLSIQAEYSINAARRALAVAGRAGEDVDLVVLGCSNLQRMYPALAIEVQDALGAHGYGFDIRSAARRRPAPPSWRRRRSSSARPSARCR